MKSPAATTSVRPESASPGVKPRWVLRDWFWFLLHNIVGWALILAAGPVGVVFPGPGGLPLFLIGFAMITLPGKRALTSRALRGVPINPQARLYRWAVAIVAILGPAGLFSWVSWLIGRKQDRWYLLDRTMWDEMIWKHAPWQVLVFIIYLSLVVLIWIFAFRGIEVINLGISLIPIARRKARPWMRRKGFDLLPPRRRKRLTQKGASIDEDILEIDDRYQKGAIRAWDRFKPWIKYLIGLVAGAGAIIRPRRRR
ncbi:MAG: hypothetical protein ABSH20_02255 [Tepidisphaeraceae bacterium]